jgi:hypothetical protein
LRSIITNRLEGALQVHSRSNYSGIGAALALAGALCGCSGSDFESSAWFKKPINPFGKNLGYSYSQLDEAKKQRRITANDYVDANGACPAPDAPPQAPPAPGAADAPGAAASSAPSQLGERVGVGMSECEVVARVGAPTSVNIGKTPRGERNVILTYNSGPRPGVYRFVSGRLTEMDRVEEPPPPPPPEPAPKKSAKSKKPPPKKDDNG